MDLYIPKATPGRPDVNLSLRLGNHCKRCQGRCKFSCLHRSDKVTVHAKVFTTFVRAKLRMVIENKKKIAELCSFVGDKHDAAMITGAPTITAVLSIAWVRPRDLGKVSDVVLSNFVLDEIASLGDEELEKFGVELAVARSCALRVIQECVQNLMPSQE